MKITVSKIDKAAEGLNVDIYGNMPYLDDQEMLPYIEIKYRCSNCNGIMFKIFNDNVIYQDKLEKPIKCIYCKLTVEPEEYN